MQKVPNQVNTDFPAIRIQSIIDEKKACEAIRSLRWKYGVFCPHCLSNKTKKNGTSARSEYLQRYKCGRCKRRFDDLTKLLFSGSHHPVSVWIVLIYLVGLNLSNLQIAAELNLDPDVAHDMASAVREGINLKKPKTILKGTTECDEVYIVAGHKGHPEAVRRKNRKGRCRRLKGAPGRGTLEKEKPPVLGIIERSGDVAIFMLPNVQQKTIEPYLRSTIAPGSLINTDEYGIYNALTKWGFSHKTVCHAAGEYARDEDGDGFHEVHVNTIEGFWSLLRSWLRPHRGISQEKLPSYLGFFEYVHNMRRRGKALLSSLVGLLVSAPA